MQKYLKYLICFLLLCAKTIFAQQTRVWVLAEQGNKTVILSDSLSLSSYLAGWTKSAITSGYLAAGIDSSFAKGDSVWQILKKGNLYTWAALKSGNADEEVLSSTGYREKLYTGKSFSPLEMAKLFEKILTYYENNGFPFASIKLDSIQINQSRISASIHIEKNQLIFIDSIEVAGNSSLKRSFIYAYTNVKAGRLYNESQVKQIDKRINQLPYARTIRPLKIYFTGNKARIITFIDSKKASQVDGILGFAPQSSINNKLVITGEVNLNLQNLLNSGKVFELHYRSFLSSSQELKARFVYPYLLGSPLGIDYNFSLLKFDSTYLQVSSDFGFQYAFGGTNYLKAFYTTQTTTLLTVDTNQIKSTRQLPDFADMKNNLYGLALKINALNYTPNPRKGAIIEMSFGAGVKKIVPNNTIKSIPFTDSQSNTYNLYDSTQLRSIQYRISGNLDKYWPLKKQSCFRTQITGASLSAKEIFVNELYQIGGIRTLKGFDEQSIFASSYIILNLEYRYLINTNSNFILFANGAWYERNTRKGKSSDTPRGLGAGMNFETGAGIFSLYYALGSQFNNPFRLREGKVHFGLVNYF